MPLPIFSKPTGTGAESSAALKKSLYCSTSPVSSSTPIEGSSFPSVCDTSKTETTLNAGTVISVSSLTGFPFLSVTGFFVLGSILSISFLILYGDGASTLILFAWLTTCRPKLFFHEVYPATKVASGFCMAISRVLLKL